MAIFVRSIISLVAVSCLEYNHIWTLASDKNPVCLSPECRQLANYMLQNIDEGIDPCHNFYGFVCHGWEKKHPRPKHELLWNVGRYLEHEALKKLRILLEHPQVPSNARVQDAKLLYKLCKNLPHLETVDAATAQEVILAIQDWPNFVCNGEELSTSLSVWTIDNYYFKRTGESALLGYSVHLGLTAPAQATVHFHAPESFFGMVIRYTKWSTVEIENYKKFLLRVTESILPENLKTCKYTLTGVVSKVFKFREDLSEIALNMNGEESELMTLEALQQWYDVLSKPDKYGQIRFEDYFNTIRKTRKNSHGQRIPEDQSVFVQRSYLRKLAEILFKTPIEVIVNHIHIHFAEAHITLTPEMEVPLIGSIIDAYSITGIIKYHAERWQTCIETHAMTGTLGKMFTEAYFPPESKEAVEKLMNEAKELFKMQISSATWLNSRTKAMTEEKAGRIGSIIGYPDWFQKFGKVNLQKPFQSPVTTEAEYIAGQNLVHVTAAYLQPPIYAPHLPYVVNYAGTVSMLGHELYHTVDENGIQIDSHGRTPWWSRRMLMKYRKQSKCFLEQYGKLKERELRKLGTHVEVNGMVTLNEDIADVMGLKLAYMGFKHKLLRNKDVCPIIPGFEKLGCEKLFFITFANAFCEASDDSNMSNLVITSHSAPKIRVNGVVANMKEFRNAFKCKKGDRMYAEKPCDLWQDGEL